MESPCIGICEINNGRCIGCKRTLSEVAEWGSMTSAEKAQVIARTNNPSLKEGQG